MYPDLKTITLLLELCPKSATKVNKDGFTAMDELVRSHCDISIFSVLHEAKTEAIKRESKNGVLYNIY